MFSKSKKQKAKAKANNQSNTQTNNRKHQRLQHEKTNLSEKVKSLTATVDDLQQKNQSTLNKQSSLSFELSQKESQIASLEATNKGSQIYTINAYLIIIFD